jgi:hypothetical protein
VHFSGGTFDPLSNETNCPWLLFFRPDQVIGKIFLPGAATVDKRLHHLPSLMVSLRGLFTAAR